MDRIKGIKEKTFIKSRWIYAKNGNKKLCKWRFEIEFFDKNIEVEPKLIVKGITN